MNDRSEELAAAVRHLAELRMLAMLGWPDIEIAELYEVLARFTDRQKEVWWLRLGLNGKRGETLEEIGRDLGITRERVRQIEAGCIASLRRYIETRERARE